MTTVTRKGQVTIPKELREDAGIRPGDDLEFEIVEGEIRIKKKSGGENSFSKWKGTLETEKTTEELIEELRE